MGADDPNVVASFADEVLSLEEFERRYVQSTGNRATASNDSLAEYRDFLERYVNFRLKVAAAGEAGIPSRPEVRDEIQSYRSSLARPFLLEQEVIDPIVREIYDRRQQIVDVSHLLVRVPPEAAPEDTLSAHRRLEAVRDSALNGVDFGELAVRHSEDPSAAGPSDGQGFRGRLGYFTGGNLVEPFESYAYETPVGDMSPIFRTDFGYHVLKVHDRRQAVPDIRVSHLVVRPEQTADDSVQVRTLLEDLKVQLDEGADFAALAEEYSQDQQSQARGGDLGVVGYTAQIPESFKEAAFALEEPGDVSDIVETSFGYHLIKLTQRETPATYDEAYEELKTLADRLPRTRAAEAELVRDILDDREGHVDTARVVRAFEGVSRDSVIVALMTDRFPESVLADTFFVLGDSSFTIRDLASDADRNVTASDRGTESVVRQLVSSFVTQRTLDLEANRLEERDDEFRRLMDEFLDGLVLYEFMEDSVWTVAERDTAGLRAYYEEHAASYRWPERTRVISLRSASDSLLEVAAGRFDDGTSIAALPELFDGDSLTTLRVDTTMIADSTYGVHDRALGLAAGERTGVISNRDTYVVLVNDGVEPPGPKSFEEARASVVSEYQDIVEERLIDSLRRRYNAHIFPERLDRAFRDGQPTASASATED